MREFNEGIGIIRSIKGLSGLIFMALLTNFLVTPMNSLGPYFIRYVHLGDENNLDLYFVDKDGKKKLVIMASYGIGIGRLMATIVEAHHDDKGIIWPKEVSPYLVHLLPLDMRDKKIVNVWVTVSERP